jgi:hypothetical protein
LNDNDNINGDSSTHSCVGNGFIDDTEVVVWNQSLLIQQLICKSWLFLSEVYVLLICRNAKVFRVNLFTIYKLLGLKFWPKYECVTNIYEAIYVYFLYVYLVDSF